MIIHRIFIISSLLLMSLTSFTAQAWQDSNTQSGQGFKNWQSGKSVTGLPGFRIKTVASRSNGSTNPWRPNPASSQPFSTGKQRPWGNVPKQRTATPKGMRYYDQQFKQWSKQLDNNYTRSIFDTNQLNSPYGTGIQRPFGAIPYGYNYPGNGWSNNTYRGYPGGGGYPYNNYYRNNSGMPGMMRSFMPW